MISPVLRVTVPERLGVRNRWKPSFRFVMAAVGAVLMGPAAAAISGVVLTLGVLP
jgi:hypothetical protein